VPRHRQDERRTGTAGRKRRDLSWLDPSDTDHHLLAHAIATVVLLAPLAALTVALLAGPSQPNRPTRESHVTSTRFTSTEAHNRGEPVEILDAIRNRYESTGIGSTTSRPGNGTASHVPSADHTSGRM
jgi:hypothetical protein